jgi:hypothetical protein
MSRPPLLIGNELSDVLPAQTSWLILMLRITPRNCVYRSIMQLAKD